VHAIDLSDITPDPALREMLLKIDRPRYIFTASVASHARRCLQRLGIADLFKGIIDCKACGLATKHSPEAFAAAMAFAGVPADEGGRCLFLDDSTKNLVVAKEMGWVTVLVGLFGRDDGARIRCEAADYEVETVHQLEEVLPSIFVGPRAPLALPAPEVAAPAFTLLYFPLMAKGLGPALVAAFTGLLWRGPPGAGFDAALHWPDGGDSDGLKRAAPFGQLPLLTVHGEAELRVGQTTAVINVLGRMATGEEVDWSLEGLPGQPFVTSQMLLAYGEELYGLLQRHCPTIFVGLGEKGKVRLKRVDAPLVTVALPSTRVASLHCR